MEHTLIIVPIIYLIIISIVADIVTRRDKKLAKQEGARRIPEKTLFAIAILGGSLSMYSTMKRIRHKTRHKRFMIGLPLIFIIQAAIITLIVIKFIG